MYAEQTITVKDAAVLKAKLELDWSPHFSNYQAKKNPMKLLTGLEPWLLNYKINEVVPISEYLKKIKKKVH